MDQRRLWQAREGRQRRAPPTTLLSLSPAPMRKVVARPRVEALLGLVKKDQAPWPHECRGEKEA